MWLVGPALDSYKKFKMNGTADDYSLGCRPFASRSPCAHVVNNPLCELNSVDYLRCVMAPAAAQRARRDGWFDSSPRVPPSPCTGALRVVNGHATPVHAARRTLCAGETPLH